MTYTYVLESAHELKSLTILLRAGHGAGEPMVRGVGDGHRLAHDSRVFCMASDRHGVHVPSCFTILPMRQR